MSSKNGPNSEVMLGVLKEEYNRLEKLERFYDEEVKKLPKGSIMKRIISNRPYYYLKYRDDSGAVRSRYIKAGDVPTISDQIHERKRMLKLLKQIKMDKKILGKVLD